MSLPRLNFPRWWLLIYDFPWKVSANCWILCKLESMTERSELSELNFRPFFPFVLFAPITPLTLLLVCIIVHTKSLPFESMKDYQQQFPTFLNAMLFKMTLEKKICNLLLPSEKHKSALCSSLSWNSLRRHTSYMFQKFSDYSYDLMKRSSSFCKCYVCR